MITLVNFPNILNTWTNNKFTFNTTWAFPKHIKTTPHIIKSTTFEQYWVPAASATHQTNRHGMKQQSWMSVEPTSHPYLETAEHSPAYCINYSYSNKHCPTRRTGASGPSPRRSKNRWLVAMAGRPWTGSFLCKNPVFNKQIIETWGHKWRERRREDKGMEAITW